VDPAAPAGTGDRKVKVGSLPQPTVIDDHGALSGLADDDHPQYLTEGRGDARYDAQGTAQGLVDAHEAAPDPHPDYLTSGEAEAPGTAQSLLAAHEAAADPHPVYLTRTEGDVAYEPLGASQTLLDAHEASPSDPHAAAGYLQSVVAGVNVTVDATDPRNPVVSSTASGGGVTDHGALTGLEDDDHPQYLRVDAGYLQSVVAGVNVTVDDTDPRNPVVSATASGGGGGSVTVSGTPPADPAAGDLWYDNADDGRLFVWDGAQWVDAAPAGEGGGGGGTFELLKVETTVTDADVLLVANTRNVLTVSGLTALRTALFPAGVVDDVIEVELATDAPTDYELIIAGDTGVSMRLRDADAVTASELTRMFIRGEAMRFVHDGIDWVCTALDDGRIPSFCSAWLSTAATGESINTVTVPTDRGGAWTLLEDNAEMARLATSKVRIRRANLYDIQQRGTVKNATTNTAIGVGFQLLGATIVFGYTISAPLGSIAALAAKRRRLNPADLVQNFYLTDGNKGLSDVNDRHTYFSVLELF
jgi:hypothetical protein